jgi:hypothetical protein
MTYFLNFRTDPVGGGASSGMMLHGDGSDPQSLQIVPDAQIAGIVAGKDLLLAAHGFNVNYADGVAQLGLLDQNLGLQAPRLMIGILWPGDFYGIGVDYPWEGEVALEAGRNLAVICNRDCQGAASLSFFSHSLGARLILEAISRMRRPDVSLACLTAGAINRRCLIEEYALSAARCKQIGVLASYRDWVLKFLFPVADPFADLLYPDHSLFQAALGYLGPADPTPPHIDRPWLIDAEEDFGHLDYMPTPDETTKLAKAERLAGFIKRALDKQPQTWPTGGP